MPTPDLPDNPRDMAGYFSTISDDEYREVMDQVGRIQRGTPEGTMLRAQREIGSGLYSHSLEHIGDLTHRINESGGRFGTEYVAPKVHSQLDALTRRYGYEREMDEQVESNKRLGYPGIDRIRELGEEYATAHEAIPVINQPTDLGRAAAVNLGRMQFGNTINSLQQLRGLTDDNDAYMHQISRRGAIDYLRGLED